MSLVGRRSENHPQQVARRGADDEVDDRRAPRDLFEQLHRLYGFTVDAAASASNTHLPRYWTKQDDALSLLWTGERIWCNPPYSGLDRWLEKAWRAMEQENCTHITMLLPSNRTEQKWWQEHVEPFRDAIANTRGGVYLVSRFLAGRLRFEHSPEWKKPPKGDRPPFGVCLLTWSRGMVVG